MIGRLNHVAIAVRDIAKAAEVYRKTLGATVSAVVPQAACGSGIALPLPATKGETCSASHPESVLPGVVEVSRRLGYCHCGCSSVRTCRTSADCGGASCDQTISCC